jgi:hypothetical protein
MLPIVVYKIHLAPWLCLDGSQIVFQVGYFILIQYPDFGSTFDSPH